MKIVDILDDDFLCFVMYSGYVFLALVSFKVLYNYLIFIYSFILRGWGLYIISIPVKIVMFIQ